MDAAAGITPAIRVSETGMQRSHPSEIKAHIRFQQGNQQRSSLEAGLSELEKLHLSYKF